MNTSESATGKTRRSLLVTIVVWAALYLPGLGALEIKGEEGRRILPAVTMLQTGNYVVPHVGSEPYFRKPPLVNWVVAASFKLFGARTEWTARIPSALCVFAVAFAFVTVARRSLGERGALIGGLVWLTSFGVLEKGRLIEIEALYVSLTGLATICWLSWWNNRRSAWLTWTVPWLFLGLGLLAKGPLHLLFFYAVVVAVLQRAGELRRFLNPAHALGLLLMVGIFAAWAVPHLQAMAGGDVAQIWTRQFTGRLSGEDFHLRGWLMNVPRGLGYFLPWTLLLPLLRGADFGTERRAQIATGLQLALAGTFLGVSLLPGSLARYTMPLLAPAAWLMAMLLTAERPHLPRWLTFGRPGWLARQLRLPAIVTALTCAAFVVYAFALMPHLQKRAKVKNIAAQINEALPPGKPLYAVDPDYQPFLFYVRDPIVYVSHVADVPNSGRYLLVQREKEEEALNSPRWLPGRPQVILRLMDYRNREVTVLEVLGPGS